MSTRGAFGFRIDGVDKIAYNHSDSYPEGLGDTVVSCITVWLQQMGAEDLRAQVRALRVVDHNSKPSEQDKEELAAYYDRNVGNKSKDDWYCLLRHTQGDPEAILDAGVLVDAAAFLKDSSSCEYAYIVNLDELTFEVYRGYQKERHTLGRYASDTPNEYDRYPCAMVGSFRLTSIPSNWADKCFPDRHD
jgi:hypothetical protein